MDIQIAGCTVLIRYVQSCNLRLNYLAVLSIIAKKRNYINLCINGANFETNLLKLVSCKLRLNLKRNWNFHPFRSKSKTYKRALV